MTIRAIKTRKFLPPKDDLFSLLKESLADFKIKERSVLVITSKIVSIWQGRCQRIKKGADKDHLIKKEADFYIDREQVPQSAVLLTIKNGTVIPSAGVDESNGNGYCIFWPKNPFKAAKEIHQFVRQNYKIKELGVIISDSHTTPQRNGVVGMGIAYHGFYPLRDYRGKRDIFGKTLKMAQANIIDSLASSAVIEMGEGKEQKPIAVIEGAGSIKFNNRDYSKNNPLAINTEIDIYAPLLKSVHWKKGGGSKR